MKSDFLKLKLRDFLKGLVLAVGTPVLYFLQELIPHWDIPSIAKIAISAGVTYLLKNLFTDGVSAAVKRVERAGGEVIEKDVNGFTNLRK